MLDGTDRFDTKLLLDLRGKDPRRGSQQQCHEECSPQVMPGPTPFPIARN